MDYGCITRSLERIVSFHSTMDGHRMGMDSGGRYGITIFRRPSINSLLRQTFLLIREIGLSQPTRIRGIRPEGARQQGGPIGEIAPAMRQRGCAGPIRPTG